MNILFTVAPGISRDQRVHRWKMVSDLFSRLAKSFLQLGHRVHFYVHPEAVTESIKPFLLTVSEDHEFFGFIMDSFSPDFVFTWNGASTGDITTTTLATTYGAKMIYGEQGWFPK